MLVAVSLATGGVRVAGRDVALSGHTLALALYLAACGRPVSRGQIAAALFRSSTSRALSAVKVYVHRLRACIGKDAIVRRADGYALSRRVWVDLPEIDALIAMGGDELHAPEARARAWRILSDLACGRPESVLRLHWFADVEHRLQAAEYRLRALYRFEAV